MIKDIENNIQEKMEKTLVVLKHELSTLRAGRANPCLLDRISVEYYGTVTPLNQLANIAVPEPRLLTVSPWDIKSIPIIEKAILKSDLGINPSNDGKMIRLIIPQLTEERRKDLVKVIKRLGEESKVAMRNIRRDANEQIKKLKKDGEISEDDLKKFEADIQKITDKYIKETDKAVEVKEKEIMEV